MPLHSAEYKASHNAKTSGETEREAKGFAGQRAEGPAAKVGRAQDQIRAGGQSQTQVQAQVQAKAQVQTKTGVLTAEGAGEGACGEVIISSPLGLHARPAAQLVQLAQQFESSITLKTDSGQADAKSILDILSLAAGIGMQLRIEIKGPDQEKALLSLTNFFSNI